ncbi:4Fe-4S binding protein [Neomoorella mulderi]|uniref:Putative electron transport protein YccM n=1 Tax=Moorella mulderi DSM 14980 TaxID=1122241 RepID=A0A151AU25_9FIRM|nr:4Fe-4S binding protein [Moorella mulderi]KYH31174.1 putative electron transport protein YccM [Moorella mulderi DSM 14980]
MKRKHSLQHWRLGVQILAFLLFVYLLISGKNKLWMLIMMAFLLITPFWGRLYCGWLCPLNTLLRPVNWLVSKKARRLAKDIPPVGKSPWLRAVIFILFLLVFLMTLRGIIKINLIVLLAPFAILTTLFFTESAWHRYLCPFGVLFSLPAGVSRWRFHINPDRCLACGRCRRVCPVGAIATNEAPGKSYRILPRYCLFCFACLEVCPRSSIELTAARPGSSREKMTRNL